LINTTKKDVWSSIPEKYRNYLWGCMHPTEISKNRIYKACGLCAKCIELRREKIFSRLRIMEIKNDSI
jgi:polyferredoxin